MQSELCSSGGVSECLTSATRYLFNLEEERLSRPTQAQVTSNGSLNLAISTALFFGSARWTR